MNSMKKFYFVLVILFSVLQSFSQDLKYSGPMNENVFTQMTPFEKILYVDCLSELQVENDSLIWVSNETLKRISKKKNYYFSIQIYTDNISEIRNRKVLAGKNRLPNPEYMISIERKGSLSEVSVTVFY